MATYKSLSKYPLFGTLCPSYFRCDSAWLIYASTNTLPASVRRQENQLFAELAEYKTKYEDLESTYKSHKVRLKLFCIDLRFIVHLVSLYILFLLLSVLIMVFHIPLIFLLRFNFLFFHFFCFSFSFFSFFLLFQRVLVKEVKTLRGQLSTMSSERNKYITQLLTVKNVLSLHSDNEIWKHLILVVIS